MTQFSQDPPAVCAAAAAAAGGVVVVVTDVVRGGRRAQVQPGKSVAVLGAGPIGLVVLMTAAAFGADQVVVTDVNQDKLSFAERHYKANTLLIDRKSSPSEVARKLQKAFVTQQKIPVGTGHEAVYAAAATGDNNGVASVDYRAPDIVIDCVGAQQSLEAAVRAVAAGGKVVLVGMRAEDITLPAQLMTCKEVSGMCVCMGGGGSMMQHLL
jgi:L-iditol 2-dehydrogenase